MKKILLSLVAITTMALSSFGQAPESFKYQAVVRDAGNLILNNQAVGVQLTIQQGSVGGTAVYTETFVPTTNAYGLVNLEIGTGTTTDNFSTIDWSNGPYFIETAIDVTGGTSYAVMGTSQLMSVPYALYAKTAKNVANDLVDDADADPTNEMNTGVVLNGTDLEVTDGNGTIVTDLSTLQNGTGTDDQNISGSGLSGTVLTIGIEGGTSETVELSSLTTSTCGLSIGDTYQGGIIFYLDASGCHGLISAPTDQSTSAKWFNGSYNDTRAYGSGLFEGKYNTQMINYAQGGTTSAAAICGNLPLGGFNDWYLPSIEELNKMYQNIGQGNALGLGNVGGFAISFYWSSTELDDTNAWRQYFGSGSQYDTNKSFNGYVRAVRAF
jgi:hypothetical protein